MSSARVLFLDILTDNAELRRELNKKIHFGKRYQELIRQKIKAPIDYFRVVEASSGELPDMDDFDMLIMGGSVEDPVPCKEKKWMKRVYKFIRTTISSKKPIFGICGGLQFTVRALGGQIIYNPKSREFGTVQIRLTPRGQKDYLFDNMPLCFPVQSSHKYMVAPLLKRGWSILATSALCSVQAIAIGENIRLVQFHPELGPSNMKALAKMRRTALQKEGIFKEKTFVEFLESIRSAKAAERLINNFIRNFT